MDNEKVVKRKDIIKEAKQSWAVMGTEWTLQEYIDDLLQAYEDDGYIIK